jgi:hypothetical protein
VLGYRVVRASGGECSDCTPHACFCGFYLDPQRECTCTPGQRVRYQGRISGPLLDRFDLVVEVRRLRAAGLEVCARPYRLLTPLEADFLKLREALERGNLHRALELYRSPSCPRARPPGSRCSTTSWRRP